MPLSLAVYKIHNQIHSCSWAFVHDRSTNTHAYPYNMDTDELGDVGGCTLTLFGCCSFPTMNHCLPLDNDGYCFLLAVKDKVEYQGVAQNTYVFRFGLHSLLHDPISKPC